MIAVLPNAIVRNIRVPWKKCPVKLQEIAHPQKNVPARAFQKLFIEGSNGHDDVLYFRVGQLRVAWKS